MRLTAALLAVLLAAPALAVAETGGPPLLLEAKIPLGEVKGRIDHLAVDLKRQRLLVAELGNDSLGVVDLSARRTMQTIVGLSEPQGVGYDPSTDTIYVANAGDGSVRLFRGEDLAPLGRIDLGDDADNVRIDIGRKRVLVGYGKGALAMIDPTSRKKIGEIKLSGHPESFQIAGSGRLVFVNVPDYREIAIADFDGGGVRSLSTDGLRANFPMAVDAAAQRVLSVFRSPPTLLALTDPAGTIASKISTCGDADDVFVDAKRTRVYVVCGAGSVDVFDAQGGNYRQIGRIDTVSGARTGLFVPGTDRLYVAARAAGSGEPAAIWVFRPAP